MCLQRFYPEVPHLGRPCWWQLLWWWSLLGGMCTFPTTRWCTCPLNGKEIVWQHVSVSGSRGWGGHPACLGVQQPHDPQTPGHVSSPTLHHILIFLLLLTYSYSISSLCSTDLSQTSLWSKVRPSQWTITLGYHFELDTAVKQH